MRRSDYDALPWEPIESSNIARVAWVKDEEADRDAGLPAIGVLYVEFHGGRAYSYDAVEESTHAELLVAESVGGYFGAAVRGEYEYERIEVEHG